MKQSNSHDYRMLPVDETPEMEVHILDSSEASGGLGEPGVPTVAPAVRNAIFAVTAQRIRKPPLESCVPKRA